VKNVNARHLVLPIILVAIAWGWGSWQLAQRPKDGPTARVEILQPDVDQYAKWNPNSANEIDAGFAQLLKMPRAQKPALIVWPESAIPRLVDEGKGVGETAEGSLLGAEQLVGVVSRRGDELFNTAELLAPNGSPLGVYHKRELVPFGEYVPFSSTLRRVIGALDQIGEISAGAERQPLLDTALGPAAATICYEAVFPRWMRLDASRGARVIFNLTNDGWYKDTWGPYQHFETNVFRAVENRVTVIRAGNTGISAVIDPWGVVTARMGLGDRGRLDVSVPTTDPFPGRSFYARHGDWFGALCLVAFFVMMAQTMRPRRP
jgi:apolipoprotein N-acyltransferase